MVVACDQITNHDMFKLAGMPESEIRKNPEGFDSDSRHRNPWGFIANIDDVLPISWVVNATSVIRGYM